MARRRFHRVGPGRVATLGTAAALLMVASTLAVLLRTDRVYRLSTEYREAAAWIRAQGGADASLAATEIGYLGYLAGGRVVDLHGLVHPELQPRIRRGDYSWWRALAPRFVVLHQPPWFAEPRLDESEVGGDPDYAPRFRVLAEGVDGGLTVFERRERRAR
jgi:hypothetical protein